LQGKRPVAFIRETCNGCTDCVKVCPVEAISGEAGRVHVVDPAKCVSCKACVEACPIQVIEMTGKKKPAPAQA
jgi:Na+-translocating ferredoxin:NAD+ oxidoreductase RNF subunit RnfB